MSPEDLSTVDRSWAELRYRQGELVARLESNFRCVGATDAAAARARWLVYAVAELVDLLAAPSRLAERARLLANSWPLTGTPPTFAIEGQAWMRAAQDVSPSWTDDTELAWRHAWLLLSDVLADETLSPFAIPVVDARCPAEGLIG
jgi:hypothetical protein